MWRIITNKQCRTCREVKPIEQFRKQRYYEDGYDINCKICYNIKCRQHARTGRAKALKAWQHINERAGNRRGDLPTYANVEVRMTKEQFLAWAIPKYNSWLQEHPDVVPSVNRIDNKGHYEIGNIEVISWGQNATKLHLHDKSKEESRLVSLVRAKCSRYLLDINNVIKLLLEK